MIIVLVFILFIFLLYSFSFIAVTKIIYGISCSMQLEQVLGAFFWSAARKSGGQKATASAPPVTDKRRWAGYRRDSGEDKDRQ